MPVDNADIEKLFRVVAANRFRKAKLEGTPIPDDVSDDMFISSEEKEHVYRWADGGELAPLVNLPGYEILIGKLQGYMDEGIKSLLTTLPADKDAVLANHAKAFAAHEIYQRLMVDVASDIEASKKTPDIVKEGILLTRGIPAESI